MNAFLVHVLSTITYVCIRSIVCVVDVYRASFKIVLYLCVHSLITPLLLVLVLLLLFCTRVKPPFLQQLFSFSIYKTNRMYVV